MKPVGPPCPRDHKHLGSYGGNREPPDTFLTRGGPRRHPDELSDAGHLLAPVELAIRPQHEPPPDDVLKGHPEAVVPDDEELLRAVEVRLDARRVCIVRVLEQLTDGGRDSSDLLATEHVDRAGTRPEPSHARSSRRGS